jgi:hypothetical protein
VHINDIIRFLGTSFSLCILGLQNPYLVLMDGDIPRCKTNAAAIGFDAISSYGLGGGGTVQGSPFSDEVQRTTQ